MALNVLFVLLWRTTRVVTTSLPDSAAMIWLQLEQPLAATTLLPSEKVARPRSRRPVAATPLAQQASQPAPRASTAITLPPVDWVAEGRRAARDAGLAAEAPPAATPLDTKPQVLEMPERGTGGPKAGDIQFREGGVIITWINERCFIRSGPPGPTMQGNMLSLPTCKTRPMKKRAAEENAENLSKELAPKMPRYLRAPPPG